MNNIDFDPAVIEGVLANGDAIFIDFPCQNFYGEAEYGQVKCHCQIQIDDAQVIVNQVKSSTLIDEFEIRSAQEFRYCFLPEGYSVNGPVVYTAKVNESVVLEVKGNNLKLLILSKNEQA